MDHLHYCTRDTQVFLDVVGPEVILRMYPTQQTNFVVPERLGVTVFRESTHPHNGEDCINVEFVTLFWMKGGKKRFDFGRRLS